MANQGLFFADFEASGLQFLSYPIEFGWAWVKDDHIEARSILIKPTPEWLSWKTGWNEEAEKLHGIPQHQLMREGLEPAQACLKINEALEGKEVAFDTGPAAHDFRWMSELYKAASAKPSFRLAQLSSDLAILAYARMLHIPDNVTLQLERLAPKTTHRAAADAAQWAWWRLALRQLATEGELSPEKIVNIARSISVNFV